MITELLFATMVCLPPTYVTNDGLWTPYDEQVAAGAKIQCAFRYPGNPCLKKLERIADRRHKVTCGPKVESK